MTGDPGPYVQLDGPLVWVPRTVPYREAGAGPLIWCRPEGPVVSPADWPLLIAITLIAWTAGMAWRWWRGRG